MFDMFDFYPYLYLDRVVDYHLHIDYMQLQHHQSRILVPPLVSLHDDVMVIIMAITVEEVIVAGVVGAWYVVRKHSIENDTVVIMDLLFCRHLHISIVAV